MLELYKCESFRQVEDMLDQLLEGVELYSFEGSTWQVARAARQLAALDTGEHLWLSVSRLGVTPNWSEFNAGLEAFGFNPEHKLAVYDTYYDEALGRWYAQRIH